MRQLPTFFSYENKFKSKDLLYTEKSIVKRKFHKTKFAIKSFYILHKFQQQLMMLDDEN